MKSTRKFQMALIVIASMFVFSISWAAGGRTLVLEPTAGACAFLVGDFAHAFLLSAKHSE